MRKRYSPEDLEFIRTQAKQGTPLAEIGDALGVSKAAISHTLARNNIKFCRKPVTPIDGEVWVPCPNVPDVQTSNMGRFVRISSESIIDGYQTTGGYTTVDFSGVGTFSAHRLVAEAFIPNPENKPEVNHIDGVKSNNRVSNLEWVSPTENIQHAIRTGLKVAKSGQEHHRTALSEQDIIQCSEMQAEGKTFTEIARERKLCRKTVARHVHNYRRSTDRSETIP